MGTPFPADEGVWGNVISSPSGAPEPRQKTNLVHSRATRKPLHGTWWQSFWIFRGACFALDWPKFLPFQFCSWGVHPLFKKFFTGFRPLQKPIFESEWGTRPPNPPPRGYATENGDSMHRSFCLQPKKNRQWWYIAHIMHRIWEN